MLHQKFQLLVAYDSFDYTVTFVAIVKGCLSAFYYDLPSM